jgi:hypothetical protein
MANELKHGTVGTELTQAEWEAVGAHVVANQAIGDIIYASSTSQLRRLGVGSTNDVLRITGGLPDWQATSFITSLGTIATGVWQGTDVGVAYGGTGVSTLAANGVLTGNGASAIVAETNLTFDGTTLTVKTGYVDILRAGHSGVAPQAYSTTAGEAAFVNLERSNNATISTHTAVDNADVLGHVSYRGSDGDSFETGAQVKGVATETWSGSARGSELVLSTTDNTTAVLDARLTIAHDGTVSIAGAVGIDYNPGSDVDTDIITVGVTGAPRLFWDESESALTYTTTGTHDTKFYLVAPTGEEPVLRFYEDSTARFQLVYAPASDWLALYNHGTGADVMRFKFADSNVQIPFNLFINDDTNVGMTLGLTINQGAADDQILAFKSSDVAHGMTTRTGGSGSDDTFAYFRKQTSGTTGGGLVIAALTEVSNAITFAAAATTANTLKTRSGICAILMDCMFKDGTGVQTYAAGAAEGNLWGVADQAAGLVLMVNEDGNLYSPTTNAHLAFLDNYDDAQLVRALSHVKTAAGDAGMIRDKWDEFIKYNEQDLIDAEVLGAPVSEGGMTSITQLQRLHNGAIWQGYTRQQEMQERVDILETKLLALEGGS